MIVPLMATMFVYKLLQRYFPDHISHYSKKIFTFRSPFVHITFHEYDRGGDSERSAAYEAISRYLNAKQATFHVVCGSDAIVLSMSEHEEFVDEFQGIKLWWAFGVSPPRFFKLRFHGKHRNLVTGEYLKHVLAEGKSISTRERCGGKYLNHVSAEGKAISIRERCRKVYRINKSSSDWSQVVFEHPATFETLAMDPVRKQEIMDDLLRFSESREYYAKIGKSWKRGYLLYGPRGTGKSTLIAAMANFLNYNVYDLKLRSVKDDTQLRKLLIDTTSKSLIVIEHIDCLTLEDRKDGMKNPITEEDKKDGVTEKTEDRKELTGQRKEDKKMEDRKKRKKKSRVTLSGLLNFIDGLWSACQGERIFVLTTNHVEKLDPALIRRGRVDKHIELSYCGFEAFKVLAKNYLGIDSHDSFATIRWLLEETNMTPADVAESLMPKLLGEDEDSCLERLIKALEEAKKKDARRKAMDREEQEKHKEKKINSDSNGLDCV